MNKYNRAALNHFADAENGAYLRAQINNHFKNMAIARYLETAFTKHHGNYVAAMEHEHLSTDLITSRYHSDQDVVTQVACLNTLFVNYMIDFLSQMFLRMETHEKLTNRNALAVNDGLNATSRTVVSAMPRARVCDLDTSAVDNPELDYLTGNNSQSFHHQEREGEKRRFRRNLVRKDVDQLVVHGAVRESADKALERQWYAHRAPQIRDDPVGELVRDRGAPGFRNQNEFPYGDRTAEGMPQLAAKSSETKCASGAPSAPGGTCAPRTQLCGPAYNHTMPRTGNQLNPRSESMVTRPTIHGGNSLCGFSAGNVHLGDNVTGGFHPEEHEYGTSESRYTGERADNEYSPVDQLLSTAYIQTLNEQKGEAPRPDAIQSAFDRAQRGPPRNNHCNPQNNVKLWHDGDGFKDQSNPSEMKELLEQRKFRSMNPGMAPACYQCAACLSNRTEMCVNSPTAYGAKHGDMPGEQIPFYERALYMREHDRDAEEAIGGFELDSINRGYGRDMMSLHCRIANKVPCGKPPVPIRKGYDQKAGPSYEDTVRQQVRAPNAAWTFKT